MMSENYFPSFNRSALPKEGGLDVANWIDDGATKEQILGATEKRRGLSPEAEPQELEWRCLDSHQCQIGAWSKETEFAKPQDVSDWKQRAKSNPVGVEIRVSFEDGQEVAWVKFFNPKADFDFSVSKILTASDGGGLMLTLKRVESGQVVEIEAYIKSMETGKVADFVNALKRETGRNLCCTLDLKELQALIQSRTSRYRKDGGRTYKLAERVGKQDDGTCVFAAQQFAADGSPTTDHDSGWVFNHQLGEEEKIPSPQIAPQNPEALKEVVTACQGFFNSEVLPSAWFVCGYSVATLQRQQVMKYEGNFPQLALFGDPGGGKTTAAQVATSLAGMHKTVLSRFSESLVYEHVKSLGGLTLLLDDPVKKGVKRDSREAIDNFLWSMFNGTTRKVRGNEQTPHSNVIVTTNVSLGEDNQALESRLIKIHFPVKQPDSKGYPALKEAMDGASGGLSQLLAIAYDRDAVKDIESRLLEFLPHAHSRIAGSLALITYFTQRFCDVAGLEFDAFTYCKEHLCPSANEFESDKDSLTDFLEKLGILKAEGIAGEWNLTQVSKGGKPYLAIHLPAIWGEFERRFNPNYSRQSLQQLAEGKGGEINSSQKFVSDKIEWLDYQRAKAEYERRDYSNWQGEDPPPPPPKRPNKTAARKCLLIPDRVVSEILGDESSDILSTNFSSYSTEASPDIEPKVTQKLPDSQKLPAKLPSLVTCETQSERESQPKVSRVTQVTEETVPPIKRGAKVEVTATGETGLVVEVEDDFATIKLDTPIQSGGTGRKFAGYPLAEIRELSANPNVKVGDRVRYEMQFWSVDRIRADGTLDLGHATLLKATSANPAEVELIGQGVAA